MPKILINEVDLTRASLQPSPTDVAFVPGLSCLAKTETSGAISGVTLDYVYCDTVKKFEDTFGTFPKVLSVVKHLEGSDNTSLDIKCSVTDGSKFISKFADLVEMSNFKRISPNKYICSTLAGTQELVLGFTSSNVEAKMEECGITEDSGQPEPEEDVTYNVTFLYFTYDLSYVYAKELITAGIPVVYKVVGNKSSYKDIWDSVANMFSDNTNNPDGLLDKGEYSIKYITSGAYPMFLYSDTTDDPFENSEDIQMLRCAEKRGDCVALIDPANCTDTFTSFDVFNRDKDKESLIDPTKIYERASKYYATIDSGTEYGAMFVPYGLYRTEAAYFVDNGTDRVDLPQLSSVILPPSFAYLITLAKSIKVNNNWLAVAGIARGQVPNLIGLYTSKRLSNSIADSYQPRNGKTSLNPITNIKPYGYTIWGNRTLKNNEVTAMGGEDGLVATSFLNIRNMVSEVKKDVYNAAKNLMFEQNSNVLWVNFLSRITPLLDRLMSGQGLSDYKVLRQPTDEKAKLKAVVKLYPLYAVEEFEVTIELSDEDVSVT